MLAWLLLLATLVSAQGVAADVAARPAETADDGAASDGIDAPDPPRTPLSRAPLVPSEYEVDEEARCEARPGVPYAACDGPRRVAVASDEARARAERLGLGTRAAADLAYIGRPPDAWIAEAGARHEGLLWPVATGLFSRGYGAGRVHGASSGRHEGIDLVQAEGAHLRAVDDGLVVYADNGIRGLGNVLLLLLGDGTVALYAHCRALYVVAGERALRGQLVGELGATGLTVRAHLHFEWRRRGRTRDPLPEMRERPDWTVRDERGGEVTWNPVPPNVLLPPTVVSAR